MASVGQEALQFFQAHGLTRAQAAGIVGNMKQESGLDPNARGGGLIQGQGGRTSKGTAHQQLEGVLKELQGPERGTFNALKSAKSPSQAARIFSQRFERPGIPMLGNREKYANEAFGGKAGGPAARTEAAPKGIPGLAKSPEMQEVPNPRAKGLEALQGLLKEEKGSSQNPLLTSGVLQKAAEPTFQPIPSAPESKVPVEQPGVTHLGAALPKGLTKFGDKQVAGWIAPILKYAQAHGWRGSVNSGYRSKQEQERIYNSGVRPAAVPGTSNHEGDAFPRGAVDVSDAQQLSQILKGSPYAGTLVWAGGKDPPHFSHPHGGSY